MPAATPRCSPTRRDARATLRGARDATPKAPSAGREEPPARAAAPSAPRGPYAGERASAHGRTIFSPRLEGRGRLGRPRRTVYALRNNDHAAWLHRVGAAGDRAVEDVPEGRGGRVEVDHPRVLHLHIVQDLLGHRAVLGAHCDGGACRGVRRHQRAGRLPHARRAGGTFVLRHRGGGGWGS